VQGRRPAWQEKLPVGPGTGWELMGGFIYRACLAKTFHASLQLHFVRKRICCRNYSSDFLSLCFPGLHNTRPV
jgi:hypothetical protein